MIRNYKIENLIGEGGMGVVYRATDTTLERTVAVKILHNHLVKDPVFYERFRNEAILLARLNHPNVTTLYNFSTDQEQSFMVMEYVEGLTLEQFLKKEKVLSADSLIQIILSAAKGLQHAHDRGILHRDIKPANIMISHKGEIKLMDFGIAKLKGSTSLTRVGSIIGTLEYMAPELLSGSAPSVASDLYAMGVVMYELLTGRLPFEGNTEASLISNILHHKPLPLRTYTTGTPKELEIILENLLRKKPERRIGSAGELQELLTRVPVSRPVAESWKTLVYKKITPLLGKASQGLRPGLKSLVKHVNTQEGYIIGGSFLIALLILLVGTRLFSSGEGGIAETEYFRSEPVSNEPVPPITAPAEEKQIEFSPAAASRLPANKEIKQITLLPEEPAKNKSVAPKNRESTPAENSPVTREEDKKQPETGEKKEESGHITNNDEIKKVVTEQKVVLQNVSVHLVLDETLSSDDPQPKGKSVAFKVSQDVYVQGIKVIAAGSSATGSVLKARSSGSGKSFLEIRPETVRAINGEMLRLKSPPLGRSGSTTEPVIFSKGIRISPDPQIINTTLKLSN